MYINYVSAYYLYNVYSLHNKFILSKKCRYYLEEYLHAPNKTI